MSSFLDTIYGATVRGFGEEKLNWKPDRNTGFMVNNYYSLLVSSNDCCFPWKSIWKQKIPSRVAFFVWTATLGKCLTIDNLHKRKIWILDWCYMCKCNGESVDHLFLHCPVAMDLLCIVSCWAPSLLARQAWSSSKWSYIVNCSPIINVVCLEGKK